MTATPLPGVGRRGIPNHVDMSYRFLEQARHEPDVPGDRLQASEKAWGAVSPILKATAIRRGWQHGGHGHINVIGEPIIRELGKDRLARTLNQANGLHQNFYENWTGADSIRIVIDSAETFVIEMEEALDELPRPYAVQDQKGQSRLNPLLGHRGHLIPIGSYSNVGFSRRDPDQDPGAFRVNAPPLPSRPAAGGQATPPGPGPGLAGGRRRLGTWAPPGSMTMRQPPQQAGQSSETSIPAE